jgi:hypothetical protein
MAKSQSKSLLRGAEGKRNNAWPGQKANVLRHCEKRSDETISKWAA